MVAGMKDNANTPTFWIRTEDGLTVPGARRRRTLAERGKSAAETAWAFVFVIGAFFAMAWLAAALFK